MDLCVRHTNRLINPIVKRVIRLAGPTRREPLLREFRNAHEL